MSFSSYFLLLVTAAAASGTPELTYNREGSIRGVAQNKHEFRTVWAFEDPPSKILHPLKDRFIIKYIISDHAKGLQRKI